MFPVPCHTLIVTATACLGRHQFHSTFKLKNGLHITTYGEYDADGNKVRNPSALPWERNNFNGAFEMKDVYKRQAVITYGAVVVPILHEFKADQVHNIVKHSEARLLDVYKRQT